MEARTSTLHSCLRGIALVNFSHFRTLDPETADLARELIDASDVQRSAFSSFVNLWMGFNGWMECVTDAANDAEMITRWPIINGSQRHMTTSWSILLTSARRWRSSRRCGQCSMFATCAANSAAMHSGDILVKSSWKKFYARASSFSRLGGALAIFRLDLNSSGPSIPFGVTSSMDPNRLRTIATMNLS